MEGMTSTDWVYVLALVIFLRWFLKRPAKKPYRRRYRYRGARRANWDGFVDRYFEPQDPGGLSLVSNTTYTPYKVLNREEAYVFYKLEAWVRGRGRGERVFPQVPMGAYLKTPNDDAHRLIGSKRPDYVIVNRRGLPICVVEYQGGGHYQGDSDLRDAIKKAALNNASIPLVEIFAYEKDDMPLVHSKLDAAVEGLDQETP